MRLGEWMKREGYQGKEVAEAVGCSRPFLSQIKQGKAEPGLRLALRIQAFTRYEVTCSELLMEGKENG